MPDQEKLVISPDWTDEERNNLARRVMNAIGDGKRHDLNRGQLFQLKAVLEVGKRELLEKLRGTLGEFIKV